MGRFTSGTRAKSSCTEKHAPSQVLLIIFRLQGPVIIDGEIARIYSISLTNTLYMVQLEAEKKLRNLIGRGKCLIENVILYS